MGWSLLPKIYSAKTFIVYVIIVSFYSESCYIVNCPNGGKRSNNPFLYDDLSNTFDLSALSNEINECPRCLIGNDLGFCYGPKICCTKKSGCYKYIGVVDKRLNVCDSENLSSIPCIPPGKTCGKFNAGKCANFQTCCTAGTCFRDKSCL
ncbi:unnamed protein product [Gordionus sp. m RMFG-2023]